MSEPNLRFNGQTYVGFSDLCGFKKMMKDHQKAYEAINHLFNSTYELLRDNTNVKALAVSDCVISWANDQRLGSIVDFASKLHRKMIERHFLMKTTVAFGSFEYQNRINLSNLSKEMICGGAYVTSFISNDKAEPGVIVLVGENNHENPNESDYKWQRCRKPKGWEYFWSANSPDEISRIESARKAADKTKFERLKDIYQGQLL